MKGKSLPEFRGFACATELENFLAGKKPGQNSTVKLAFVSRNVDR